MRVGDKVEKVVVTLEHKTTLFGTIRGDSREAATGPTTISTGVSGN